MTECRGAPAADGTSRCLPAQAVPLAATYFSDAGCSVPLQVAVDNRASCPGQLPPQFVDDLVVMACGAGGEHIYPIGTAYSGPLFSGTPASCTVATSNLPLYTVGAELPPSTFSLMTQRTGP